MKVPVCRICGTPHFVRPPHLFAPSPPVKRQKIIATYTPPAKAKKAKKKA